MRNKRIVLCGIVLLMIMACGGNYGGVQINDKVEKSFVGGEIKPNLTYYYFGREAAPDAIMALDKGFVLENPDMWYPIVPQTSENLRALTKMMYDRLRMEYSFPPPTLRGFRLLDQHGRYVGEWYSPWEHTNFVTSDGGSRVLVYPPRVSAPGDRPGGGGLFRRGRSR